MNEFYVYVHTLPDGTPFYVGKGSEGRATSTTGRSTWWHRTVKKHYGNEFPHHNVLIENITEADAFAKETEMIGLYGRKDKSLGPLVNMTDGGDGHTGYIMTDESKRKLSDRKKGMKFSEEHKKRLSDAAKNRMLLNPSDTAAKVNSMAKARRTFTAAILENTFSKERSVVTNVSEFARKNKLHQGHISDVISGSRTSHKKWILIIKRK
jgi:hypothetical protein